MSLPPAPRVLVLASGEGSNFEALARALAEGRAKLELRALISDRPGAPCLARARAHGVEALALSPAGEARRGYDRRLAELAASFEPDWILLLGWMRLLSMEFLGRFPGRVINLHPALPGAFPGVEAIRRSWEGRGLPGSPRAGVMLHLVPDEGVDSGPVLLSRECPPVPGEDLPAFEKRMHDLEHELVVELAGRLRREGFDGRERAAGPLERKGA